MQHPAAAPKISGGIAFAGVGRETAEDLGTKVVKALEKIGYTNAGRRVPDG